MVIQPLQFQQLAIKSTADTGTIDNTNHKLTVHSHNHYHSNVLYSNKNGKGHIFCSAARKNIRWQSSGCERDRLIVRRIKLRSIREG